MTTTIIVVALCSVLLAPGKALPSRKSRIVADTSPYRSLNRLALRFQEICRTVLDPKALTFLRETVFLAEDHLSIRKVIRDLRIEGVQRPRSTRS
jgi:hypothetical protein